MYVYLGTSSGPMGNRFAVMDDQQQLLCITGWYGLETRNSLGQFSSASLTATGPDWRNYHRAQSRWAKGQVREISNIYAAHNSFVLFVLFFRWKVYKTNWFVS